MKTCTISYEENLGAKLNDGAKTVVQSSISLLLNEDEIILILLKHAIKHHMSDSY